MHSVKCFLEYLMKNLKILIFLLIAALTSCNSYKKVPYIQNSDSVNVFKDNAVLYDARIQPKDLLTITVNCSNKTVSAPFNLTVQSTYTNTLYSSGALQTYLVDNNGNIDFPVLGQLTVGGKTKSECEDMIREKLKDYIKDEVPVVSVRMSNYKISVLGEVSSPGVFIISNEKVNIFEALALAKDLTIYGKRDAVKLIRENDKGEKEIVRLDLNDARIISSPYYYLQQNDIIYVEPNKAKAKNSDIGNSTSLWFTTVSIVISLASLMYNILK